MKISDLVNKVEQFRFEYDEFVLEGEYYKYRTATPKYAKEIRAEIVPEGATDEEKEQSSIKIGARMLADTIKTWNATDDAGNEMAVNVETFESLPVPFTTKFLEFIQSLRDGNPTNGNGSQAGSLAS